MVVVHTSLRGEEVALGRAPGRVAGCRENRRANGRVLASVERGKDGRRLAALAVGENGLVVERERHERRELV